MDNRTTMSRTYQWIEHNTGIAFDAVSDRTVLLLAEAVEGNCTHPEVLPGSNPHNPAAVDQCACCQARLERGRRGI